MKNNEWSPKDILMVTSDGNIKHYLNDDRIEEFNCGDVADLSFPTGYGHCRRVYRGFALLLRVHQ